VPQVNRQLTNVNEGVLIAGVEIKAIELNNTVGHKVEQGEVLGVHGLARLDKIEVNSLEDKVNERMWAEDAQLPNDEEGNNPDRLF